MFLCASGLFLSVQDRCNIMYIGRIEEKLNECARSCVLAQEELRKTTDLQNLPPRLPSMSKLRDWWPSNDFLKHRLSTSNVPQNVFPASQTSRADNKYRAALKLSDIATALQSLPNGTSNSVLSQTTVLSAAQPLSRGIQNALQKELPSTPLSQQAYSRPSKGLKNTKNKRTAQTSINFKSRNDILHQLQCHPINKVELSKREIHIYSERLRRQGMTHLYATLNSLLPDAKPKTDRCTILTKTMKHIKVLQKKLVELGQKKAEIAASLGGSKRSTIQARECILSADMYQTSDEHSALAMGDSSHQYTQVKISVRFCGEDAFIILSSPRKKGLWPGIMELLFEKNFEVLNATRWTSTHTDFHFIHAKVPHKSDVRCYDLQKMLQDITLDDVRNQTHGG